MVKVLVRDNNVEQALRVAKRKSQKEGLYREMKERQRFEKPTTKRKRMKEEAVLGIFYFYFCFFTSQNLRPDILSLPFRL